MADKTKEMLLDRMTDLEEAIDKALRAASVFIQGRPDELEYTPGERDLLDALSELGELVGFGEADD